MKPPPNLDIEARNLWWKSRDQILNLKSHYLKERGLPKVLAACNLLDCLSHLPDEFQEPDLWHYVKSIALRTIQQIEDSDFDPVISHLATQVLQCSAAIAHQRHIRHTRTNPCSP